MEFNDLRKCYRLSWELKDEQNLDRKRKRESKEYGLLQNVCYDYKGNMEKQNIKFQVEIVFWF